MKKGFNFLVGGVLLSFVIPSAFAVTCPSIKTVNSAIEAKKATLSIGEKNKVVWDLPQKFPDMLLGGFKGAYYQAKTDYVKKASLTCTYTDTYTPDYKGSTYFNLKLSDETVEKIDTAFNGNWDNFYNPSLYSCDGKGVHIADCKFELKTK